MKNTPSKPTYLLGSTIDGREFIYTDLPSFKSGMEARDYALAHNHTGYVFEHRDLYRNGVNYGTSLEIVATI